jgi:hypothetical protein
VVVGRFDIRLDAHCGAFLAAKRQVMCLQTLLQLQNMNEEFLMSITGAAGSLNGIETNWRRRSSNHHLLAGTGSRPSSP